MYSKIGKLIWLVTNYIKEISHEIYVYNLMRKSLQSRYRIICFHMERNYKIKTPSRWSYSQVMPGLTRVKEIKYKMELACTPRTFLFNHPIKFKLVKFWSTREAVLHRLYHGIDIWQWLTFEGGSKKDDRTSEANKKEIYRSFICFASGIKTWI